MLKKIVAAAIGLAAAGACTVAVAASISGAGATFPYPVYSKWAETYRAQTGTALNYQAIGSGGGIRQINASTVDFGASDKPQKPDDLAAMGLTQFPTVIGGVVPVVNLPGVQAGQLRLPGKLVADIFRGVDKYWDDRTIQSYNPTLRLPHLPISVVHRSDGSGTTFLFTTYLSNIATGWQTSVGGNDSVNWPVGQGGKGNDGVAALVRATPGAIGYVEYAYARQNGMAHVQMQNRAGQWVQPTAAAFAAAAQGAKWDPSKGFYLLLLDQPQPQAWPITGATFILVHTRQENAQAGHDVLAFFDWAYKNGDATAARLDYVPLPESVKAMVRRSWSAVKGPDGRPVYP